MTQNEITDADSFGFSSTNTGKQNYLAFQKAVEKTGTITVTKPGIYLMAGTVYLKSHTTLIFSQGVILRKTNEIGPFSHVFVNEGAKNKSWNEDIEIRGLHLEVANLDCVDFKVAYGLRGQIAFHYIQDLRIFDFTCEDVGVAQYCLQICIFEKIVVDTVSIYGKKDGVHLGRGKDFVIRNGQFRTGDDAVALNAHDYSTGNPELGWIENGFVENCVDLPNEPRVGYFCRILAGAWRPWLSGMEVQQSDTVASEGKLYRVQMNPDGKIFTSLTKPTHDKGYVTNDGIRWGVVQYDETLSCGVRNVTFKNIELQQPRTAFSIHFDADKYSRSFYPGSEIPHQKGIVLDNVRVMYNDNVTFLGCRTPVDQITISNSLLRNSSFVFSTVSGLVEPGETKILLDNIKFNHDKPLLLIKNSVLNKKIFVNTSNSQMGTNQMELTYDDGKGSVVLEGDLVLRKTTEK